MSAPPEGFEEFVAAVAPRLRRTAWLLTGNSDAAEDLVQEALAKTWRHWARVRRYEQPEAYVRRVMVTTNISWWRRRRHAVEIPVGETLEPHGHNVDDTAAVDVRDVVRAALSQLPTRQRAVIVLRHFEDLSEAQTAEALGCSVGTVKSQNARALARLRDSNLLSELDPSDAGRITQPRANSRIGVVDV